jgi:hypothetical protein
MQRSVSIAVAWTELPMLYPGLGLRMTDSEEPCAALQQSASADRFVGRCCQRNMK